MAAMLAAVLRNTGIRADCVVPVPSHPWSSLRRGFSPATELARPVARDLELPLRRAIARRWTPWTSAKRLSRAERRRFGARAFRLNGNLEDQRVLLVDDLVTTGSTLANCFRLCKDGGARQVQALVWARNHGERRGLDSG